MSRKDKTMISASVVNTDGFTNLPHSAQALWLHLNIAADHYGILASTQRILRAGGFDESDLTTLVKQGFIIHLEPGGTLYAIADWWNMNNPHKRLSTDHGKEIGGNLCIMRGSGRYVAQREAGEETQPTGEYDYGIIPIFAPVDKSGTSAGQVPDKSGTSTTQYKGNENKGNATEKEMQQQSISKPKQDNKKESAYPGASMGECPDCRAAVLFTDYGTQRVFDCPSCGQITVDTATGERI